jgi:hypothetical protein
MYYFRQLKEKGGGEKGIRTLDTVTRIHTFQACAFNHSATSPTLAGTYTEVVEDQALASHNCHCLAHLQVYVRVTT